jgi:diguanylate cyclase (GGDEF)-like protein
MNRKHARTTTKLPAQVQFTDAIFTGTVTGYSETGLLVTFSEGDHATIASSARVGSELRVTILAEHGESSPPLEIKGHVARIAPEGVGVRFPRLMASTLQKLREADARLAASPALLESWGERALQRECNSLFGQFLDQILDEFFARATDDLLWAGDAEHSFQERSRYRMMVEDLAHQRTHIEAEFFGSIRAHLHRIALSPGYEDTPSPNAETLRVLEEIELEDSLSLEAASKEIEAALAVDLAEFENHYCRLVRKHIERPDNPFAPSAIFHALKVAIQTLDTTNNVRTVLYRTIGQAIAKHGPKLYQRLNNVLGSLRPLPHAPEPSKSSSQPASESTDLLRLIDRLQEKRRNRPREAPHGSDVDANAPTLQKIMAALDHLPLGGLTAKNASAHRLSDYVEADLAAMEGVSSRLALAHRRILDTTSQLIGRARTDIVPESEIEDLVQHLERPLLKLALKDQGFPAKPDHPARQALNLIERYSVVTDERGRLTDPHLRRFLKLVVDRLRTQGDQDPDTYELARKNLLKVLKPILGIRRNRVSVLQEASEALYRVRTGRARVNEALEQKLCGREVPSALLRLLDAGWRQHMILLETREGTESPEWLAALNLIDRLRENLTAPGSAAVDVPGLLNEIEEGLSTVNIDTDLRDDVIKEMKEQLEGTAPPMPMVFIPSGSLAPPQASAPENYRYVTDGLRIGDWWALKQKGKWVPMQLVWLSPSRSSCTFADLSAKRKLDLTFDDLARRIRENVAKPEIDRDLPLLDRAEFSLLDDSYRSLLHQTHHDPVTGLLNRKGFMQRLQGLQSLEHRDRSHVIGVLEFDQFRLIRNNCGEEACESLVREIVKHAVAAAGLSTTVAALREDTIAVLASDCGGVDKMTWGTALLDQLKFFTFRHDEQSYRIGFSLGLSEFVPSQAPAAEALRRADAACISAKSMGRNQVRAYEQETAQMQTLERQMDLAGHLDRYLEGDGLFLRCQQVMPLADPPSEQSYFEVLLGVRDKDGAVMNAFDFVTAVERLNRVHELDLWVIENVFAWIAANRPLFDVLGGFAINLSASSLHNHEVYQRLRDLLAGADFPTEKIVFEITESAAIEHYGTAQDFIRGLRQYGSRFCLDDFGTGFTSYAHLRNLRADKLKIDGSFVRDMLTNEADLAMVKSMNDLAHSLGLTSVAEYVESPELVEAVKAIGVDYGQGHAIHKPCPIDELSFVLADTRAETESSQLVP